jgi:hypothetical protein
MVTALRGGSGLEGPLRATVEVLRQQQSASVKRFVAELNLWALMFLIFAVAIPGLGSTLLIVASAFGAIKINEASYVLLIGVAVLFEFIVIGFVKSRRPVVPF